MRWLMTFRIALRALARNKLRAFLTMLGIIIGVGAVIAMVAIGEGAKATIRSQISALGTNVLVILPGSNVQGGVRAGSGNRYTLLDSDARAMTRELRSVAYASPVLRRQEQVIAGNLNWGTLAQGVAPEFEQIRDWQIESGRFLHEGDMDSAAKVTVIGQTVARQLFGNDDPIDSVIRIRNIPFRVVGLLVGKGQTGHGQDQDDTVMVPTRLCKNGSCVLPTCRASWSEPSAPKKFRKRRSKLLCCCASATALPKGARMISLCAISRTSPRRRRAPRG